MDWTVGPRGLLPGLGSDIQLGDPDLDPHVQICGSDADRIRNTLRHPVVLELLRSDREVRIEGRSVTLSGRGFHLEHAHEALNAVVGLAAALLEGDDQRR